jgi:hypothetical protein
MGNCGYVNLLADLVKLHGPGALNRPCLISHGRGPQARCKVQAIRDPCRVCGGCHSRQKTVSDLSERTRRLLTITAVAEGILKLAALIDIKRRPASQIRGPKWLWAAVVAVVSSAGVVPISYFVFGRRQPGSQPD